MERSDTDELKMTRFWPGHAPRSVNQYCILYSLLKTDSDVVFTCRQRRVVHEFLSKHLGNHGRNQKENFILIIYGTYRKYLKLTQGYYFLFTV